MPREKVFNASGVSRRVTISGWDVNIQVGQPLNKTSVGCRLLVELVENGSVVDAKSSSFNINGADLAAFLLAVEARKATYVAGGVAVPQAMVRAWRREMYER